MELKASMVSAVARKVAMLCAFLSVSGRLFQRTGEALSLSMFFSSPPFLTESKNVYSLQWEQERRRTTVMDCMGVTVQLTPSLP